VVSPRRDSKSVTPRQAHAWTDTAAKTRAAQPIARIPRVVSQRQLASWGKSTEPTDRRQGEKNFFRALSSYLSKEVTLIEKTLRD